MLLILLALSACSQADSQASDKQPEQNAVLNNPDYVLLKNNCFACHNPNSNSHDEMLAPPLAGIKMRYMKDYGNRQEFIDAMAGFASNPTKEAAKMQGPVRRFGLMPKPVVEKEELMKIVAFIYDNELEKPDWFDEHHEKMGKN